MNEPGSGFLSLTKQHFATVALVLAFSGGISKIWPEAPPVAYLGGLLLAPAIAVLQNGFGTLAERRRLKRGNRLLFPDGTVDKVSKAILDLLGQVRTRQAGLMVREFDAKKVDRWVDTLLKSLHQGLKVTSQSLPSDTYVVWLQADSASEKIKHGQSYNLGKDAIESHVEFAPGDAFAGAVWAQGKPACHSAREPHGAWQTRPGCDNASYICVPVGDVSGRGGVLGCGSNTGFMPTQAMVRVMELFASVLGLLADAKAPEKSPDITKNKTR